MSATRRDFQRIADGVRYVAQDPSTDVSTVLKMVRELDSALATMNPNFNRSRFERACGVDTDRGLVCVAESLTQRMDGAR